MNAIRRLWNRYFGRREKYVVVDFHPDVVDGTNAGVLSVKGVDFCIDSNGESHHTSKFNLMTRESNKCLVVRRGQPFKLDILLNRPYENGKDAISFIFNVSDMERRGPNQGSVAAVPLLERGAETMNSWNAVYEGQIDNHVLVAITPASDCIVAAWNLDIDTKLISGGSLSYTHPEPVYILFNPWSLNDTVYMPGSSQRSEYVLEDGGLMFRGVRSRIKPTPWNYAQYERDVLDCALYLSRQIGKVRGNARGDPIQTCRALSAAVNAQDDEGVLIGNWNLELSDYSGGTHPVKWVGSLQILQKYYLKKKPVKYAQCWVYAGVLTTLCRALGIPCRPVTAYSAAHDSQGSLTIDVIKDDDGRTINEFTRDSIWNYHVWNDVWMERGDLGGAYGGWQALDATPQEQSDNLFRCGPASLRAVREGDIQRPYDAAYVYAQVNADKVIWKYAGEIQPLKMIDRDTVSIGQKISTKAIGKMELEDITPLYKYEERSAEERSTMVRALHKSESIFARYYLNEQFNDVQFELELLDDIKIGESFNVLLHIRNRSTEASHRVRAVLRVDAVTYTGVAGASVRRHEVDELVPAGDKRSVRLELTFQDYYPHLMEQAAFNVACMASIPDINYDYFAQDDFRVRNPDIHIALDGEPVSRRQLSLSLRIENPLPVPLTRCKFYVQAPGLDEQLKIALDHNVGPGELATASLLLTPPWSGRHQVSAKFTSRELRDVDGFLVFLAAPAPPATAATTATTVTSTNELNGHSNNTEINDLV